MKAIAKTRPEVGVDIVDVPEPTPGPGEVLVKVAACGICGTDLHTYDWSPAGQERRGKPIELPRILGHEPSGIVAELGPGVTNVAVGDRVASDSWGGCGQCYYCRSGKVNLCEPRYNIGSLRDGALAEYVVVPAFNLHRLPDDIPLEVGAMFQPFGVAVHAVERATEMRPGDTAVVIGPGPIGLMVALVARAGGARVYVAGLTSDKVRLETAAALGLRTITSDTDDGLAQVLQATNGRGADVVFEAAGVLPATLPFVRKGGLVVAMGTTNAPITLDMGEVLRKELTITTNLGRAATTWHRTITMVSAGAVDLRPLITHRLLLDDATLAFETLRKGLGVKALLFPNGVELGKE